MESVSSLDKVKAYINSIDFTMIIEKMIKHQGWQKKDVLTACQLYRNFLFLNKKYGDSYSLPPSEEIDEFWHNHILDTQKYIEDSQVIFDKYLHHYPYFGIDGKTTQKDLTDAFKVTQELHFQEFGSSIPRIKKLKTKEAIKLFIHTMKSVNK